MQEELCGNKLRGCRQAALVQSMAPLNAEVPYRSKVDFKSGMCCLAQLNAMQK